MIDPLKEKEASRVAIKMGFREFTYNIIEKIAETFLIPVEMLMDDRWQYSKYRYMWE